MKKFTQIYTFLMTNDFNLNRTRLCQHIQKNVLCPTLQNRCMILLQTLRLILIFLPWCAATRIRKVTKDSHKTIIEADLIIAFKVFRERFGSRVTLKG